MLMQTLNYNEIVFLEKFYDHQHPHVNNFDADLDVSSLMFYAITTHSLQLIDILLADGVNIDIQSNCAKEWSPLHYAVHSYRDKNDLYLIEYLLQKDAYTNCINFYGESILFTAYTKKTPDVYPLVSLLAKYGAKFNQCDNIYYAIYDNDVFTIRENINKLERIRHHDSSGNTLLQLALKMKRFDIAKVIIDKRLFLTDVDLDGNTPLHTLATLGSCQNHSTKQSVMELSTLLCASLNDINAVNSYGKNVLHIAVQNNRDDLVRLFLLHGVNSNAVDRFGKIPKDYIISNTVAYLL